MLSVRVFAISLLTALTAVLLTSAALSTQVTGLDIAEFDGREVLVIRTSSDIPAPSAYSRDTANSKISFSLEKVGADSVSAISGNGLILGARTMPADKGTKFEVQLSSPALAEQSQLRFSKPSEHVILLEVFPPELPKSGSTLISDVGSQLGIQAAPPAAPAAPSRPEAVGIDSLGIPTIDLSSSNPQQVLSLAASTGLLDIKSMARVATENLGELTVKPAGQSLANWSETSPPGELFLSGTPSQIANFMQLAQASHVAGQPLFTDYWAENKPPSTIRSASIGGSAATRSRVKDDPFAGIYSTETLGRSRMLSDVRVTLPATSGMNLYDVLEYLSLISGISLIIDPYTFDEPTGMRRDPLEPDPPGGSNNAPGFRDAGQFMPGTGRPGTVIGNLDNVPFDMALELILETHGLRYVVYGGDGGSQRYGKNNAASAGGEYTKPVVLVTSRERLEQELSGQNNIDLYQFHYADPYLATELLNNFSLLPGEDTGWYIYQGGGGSVGFGNGGGGNNSGGGIGGGGGGNFRGASRNPGLLVYRGSSRDMIYQEVAAAVGSGENLIRVKLSPESGGMLVTALSH